MKRIAFAFLVIALAGCAHSAGSGMPTTAVGAEPTGAAPPPPPPPPPPTQDEALAQAEAHVRAAAEREQRQREMQAREAAERQARESHQEALQARTMAEREALAERAMEGSPAPRTAATRGAAAAGSSSPAMPLTAGTDTSDESSNGDQLASEIDEADALLARLRWGHVAFNAPQTINIKDTIKVRALVSPDESANAMKVQIDAPGEQVVESVQVSKFMEARLTGVGFTIVPISQAQQVVGSGITTWEWEVTPEKEGRHRLNLSLDAFVRMDGQNVARTRTFNRDIDVDVTVSQRIGGWVDQHGKWAWSTLLVPLWAWWNNKRKKAKPGSETA